MPNNELHVTFNPEESLLLSEAARVTGRDGSGFVKALTLEVAGRVLDNCTLLVCEVDKVDTVYDQFIGWSEDDPSCPVLWQLDALSALRKR
jgi:uncharacterized protein (DUF1778 family)